MVEKVQNKMPRVVYCQITSRQQSPDALKNIMDARAFVDGTILVYDDIDPIVEERLEETGTIKIHEPLDDNFAEFRMKYIRKARELGYDYLLFSDTDEHYDPTFLASLKQIILLCPQYNGFEIYCHYDIVHRELMDDNEIHREAPGGLDENTNWWKLGLIRLEPDMDYTGHGPRHNTHEYLTSPEWRVIKLPKKFFFTQRKSAEQIWRNCARQIVISGGALGEAGNNPVYNELMPILTRLKLTDWTKFEKYCQKGKINKAIKDIFIKHRNDSKHHVDSENRSLFKWYFGMHPEENTQHLKSEFNKDEYVDVVRDMVRSAYFTGLGRDADIGGLTHYVGEIMSGRLSPEKLVPAMKESPEYMHNYLNMTYVELYGRGATDAEENLWAKILKEGSVVDLPKLLIGMAEYTKVRVAYCQMTHKGDLENSITNVRNAKPYADVCIVVYDDSLNREDVNRLREAGARCRYYKWHDNFPEMRNNYLLEARIYGATWVLVSDPDEHHDEAFLKRMKELARLADNAGINMLMVNAHDIMADNDKGVLLPTPTETVSGYRKNLFYHLNPDMFYIGVGETKNLHETMTGVIRAVNLGDEYFYRHEKSWANDIWPHSTRNIYISGGGMNQGMKVPQYKQFKEIMARLDLKTWYEFRDYLKAGKIDDELAQFIKDHRSDNTGHDYDSEYREMFKYYYYRLHPEENTEHLEADDHAPLTVVPEVKEETTPVDPNMQIPQDTIEYVRQTYRDILRRDADNDGPESGLQHYSREITSGKIKKDDLPNILKSSQEYKILQTFGGASKP